MNRSLPSVDKLALAWGKLLPHDVIHYTAPANRLNAPSCAVVDNIDAANAKRARKNAARLTKEAKCI